MPAKAGIQNYLKTLDSRLRGNDARGRFKTFYETISVEHRIMMSLRSAIRFKLFSNIRYQPFWITKAGFVVKININGGIVIRSVEFLAEIAGEYTFEKC